MLSEGETKAQRAGCCLFLVPPLWPLLIIVSPILWLIHAIEKKTKKINLLKNPPKEWVDFHRMMNITEAANILEGGKYNPYHPFETKEEYLEWLRKAEKEISLTRSTVKNSITFHNMVRALEIRDRLKQEREEQKRDTKERKNNPYYPFQTREEYINNQAEEEKALRKQEQNEILAKSYQQREASKNFKANLKQVDDLIKLSPLEFEKWVKKNIFESAGWEVEETKASGDGGVDLHLVRKGEHSIAQCKRFKGTVGEPMLRDFYGTMMHEGVSRGFFVTTGLYSLSALKFAEDKPIEMIDRRVLASVYM